MALLRTPATQGSERRMREALHSPREERLDSTRASLRIGATSPVGVACAGVPDASAIAGPHASHAPSSRA